MNDVFYVVKLLNLGKWRDKEGEGSVAREKKYKCVCVDGGIMCELGSQLKYIVTDWEREGSILLL